MFIPSHKQNICTRFSFSRFVFRVSGQSIFGGGGIAHFAHVEVLYLAF
jgi:hypothetical protein